MRVDLAHFSPDCLCGEGNDPGANTACLVEFQSFSSVDWLDTLTAITSRMDQISINQQRWIWSAETTVPRLHDLAGGWSLRDKW